MAAEPRRNEPCPCGSGLKYKHCCAHGTSGFTWSYMLIALVVVALTVAVMAIGVSFSDRGDTPSCPPGQTWSEAHGHCH